jgi:hypothetical protein
VGRTIFPQSLPRIGSSCAASRAVPKKTALATLGLALGLFCPTVGSEARTSKNKQADRRKGRQAQRQAGTKAGRHKGRQADRHKGRQAQRQAGTKADRQAGTKAGRQAGRQAGTKAGRHKGRQAMRGYDDGEVVKKRRDICMILRDLCGKRNSRLEHVRNGFAMGFVLIRCKYLTFR